ncbi:MAG: MarR family transcriptional regulator [Parvibaculaceae bacterium]|nr:MarR family transcriptional regulator [Parvibaculaceae bacterium]
MSDNKPYTVETYSVDRSIGYLVRRASTLITEIIERTSLEQGLNFTQWMALKHLDNDPNLTLTELARRLNHDQGSLSRTVEQLDQQGFLARRRCGSDRRQIRLELTPEGRAFVVAQTHHVVALLNGILEPFSPEEIESLISNLNKLVHRLEDFSKPGSTKSPD